MQSQQCTSVPPSEMSSPPNLCKFDHTLSVNSFEEIVKQHQQHPAQKSLVIYAALDQAGEKFFAPRIPPTPLPQRQLSLIYNIPIQPRQD